MTGEARTCFFGCAGVKLPMRIEDVAYEAIGIAIVRIGDIAGRKAPVNARMRGTSASAPIMADVEEGRRRRRCST